MQFFRRPLTFLTACFVPLVSGAQAQSPEPTLALGDDAIPVVSWFKLDDQAFSVQRSQDLVTWTDEQRLPEVSADGAIYSQAVSVPQGGQQRGFYRLRERPADVFSISETPPPGGMPQIISVVDDGQLRRYRLYLPPAYSAPAPASRRCDDGYPLAIICHGSGQTAADFVSQHPALITKCATEDVILVVPQGTWNAESMKHSFNSLDDQGRRDDVGFVVRIAEQLQQALWVDRDRIYVGGFSNGGVFSQRAVSRSPGTFAAFTAIASALGGQAGQNQGAPIIRVPLPIDYSASPALIVNGRLDAARPFDGGPSNGNGPIQTPALEMPTFWREALRCPDAFTTTIIPGPGGGGNNAGQIESACAGTPKEVLFVDLKMMDHIWPDAADNVGWDANLEVIDFFLSHERGAIDDTADPSPIAAPTHWTSTTLSGSDVLYNIPTAPAAMVFLVHDDGADIDSAYDLEMVEILAGLEAEGIGFFAATHLGASWDLASDDPASNPDLQQLLDLHANLVATTALDADTYIVPLGVGTGGHFALLAGEILNGSTFPVGGVAMLATPMAKPLPALVESALNLTDLALYFANGENDATAPPLPAWEEFRRLSVYSTEQKQFGVSDYFPGRRKRVTSARFRRLPGISAADANSVIASLLAGGTIDAGGAPLICPGDVDCETHPLPAGFSASQEEQLRKQLCAVVAGHAVDSSCLPSLRRFCIGARRLPDPDPAPLPTSAPADGTSIDPVPPIPWTVSTDIDGLPVRVYVPASPIALTYFFHGTSGGIDFYDRLEQREMIHALHDAGIAVVCAVSLDRDNLKSPKARWDGRSFHPHSDVVFTDNPDWQRMMGLRDQLIALTNVTSSTPLFSMGFSNGGGFALTFGFLAQQSGLDFRGAAMHAQPAFDEGFFRASRRLSAGTQVFLTALANDNTAAKIPVLADMLGLLGHQVTLHIGEELSLKPERFQRIPGVTPAQSQQIFDNLVTDGAIDASGLRTIPLNAPVPGSNEEVKRQLRSTIFSDHVFSARFIDEEIAWFESLLP